jgi:hypothetical protein
MSKKINVDFYRIDLTDNREKFEDLLQRVMSLSKKQRIMDVGATPINFHTASSDGEFWHGEVIRIRMVDPPVKASREGAIEDILLDDDEGIGEKTAFLYHCQTKILLVQSTQGGVSISTFLTYFNKIFQNIRVFADPVLQLDAMKRLNRLDTVQKFEVRVAGLDNPGKLFQDDDLAIGALHDIAEQFHAPIVSITLSTGKKKKHSLDVKSTVEAAKKFLLIGNHAKNSSGKKQKAQTIRITGFATEDEEGEMKRTKLFVDLLHDRMRERVDSDMTGRRSIPYVSRVEALKKAWENRQAEILEMFS